MSESRFARPLSVLLGTCMLLFGVGLMAFSGHLLSRAAQQPESLLLLMPTVTLVRFFGIGRAFLRYLERLVSHDVTLQGLARTRLLQMKQHLAHWTYRLLGQQKGDTLETLRKESEVLQNQFLKVTLPVVAGWTVFALVTAGLVLGLPVLLGPWLVGSLLGLFLLPRLGYMRFRTLHQRLQQVRHQRSKQLQHQLRHSLEWRFLHVSPDHTLEYLDRDLQGLETRVRTLQLRFQLLREVGVALCQLWALWLLPQTGLPAVWMAGLWLGLLAAFDTHLPALGAVSDAAAASLMDPPRAVEQQEPVQVPFQGLKGSIEGQQVVLAEGTRLLVTGPSGVGKSTLLEGWMGLRDLPVGQFFTAGQDLALLEGRGSLFSWAPQEPYVLDGHLLDNLGHPAPEVALPLLQALHFPADLCSVAGLQLPIGEGGRSLSGGEKARLQVARALLHPAPVLLLDEPTAHLDPETALAVVKAVQQWAGDRAVVVVTHQPEHFAGWDRVTLEGVPSAF